MCRIIVSSSLRFFSRIFRFRFAKRPLLLFDWIYNQWISVKFRNASGRHYISRSAKVQGKKYISIGDGFYLGKYSVLIAIDNYNDKVYTPSIVFGENTMIGDFANISAICEIIFGNNVLVGKWLTVVDNSHGMLTASSILVPVWRRDLTHKGTVRIGNNVWIGDKVTILPGVTVGDNAIIGANSLVSKDVPANSIVGGNPAVVLRTLYSE